MLFFSSILCFFRVQPRTLNECDPPPAFTFMPPCCPIKENYQWKDLNIISFDISENKYVQFVPKQLFSFFGSFLGDQWSMVNLAQQVSMKAEGVAVCYTWSEQPQKFSNMSITPQKSEIEFSPIILDTDSWHENPWNWRRRKSFLLTTQIEFPQKSPIKFNWNIIFNKVKWWNGRSISKPNQ